MKDSLDLARKGRLLQMRGLTLDVPNKIDSEMIDVLYNPEDIKVELIKEEFGHKLPHSKTRITIGKFIMEIRGDDADKIAALVHKITRKRPIKHQTPKD